MRKFRIEYRNVYGTKQEVVEFENGEIERIYIDKRNGNKFFHVRNQKAKEAYEDNFNYCIKDAYEAVLNDDGDLVISINDVNDKLYANVFVVRFVDREIGEKIRDNFLNEWKDAQFGYSIEFWNEETGCYDMLKSNMSFLSNYMDYKIFQHKEKAIEFINTQSRVAINLVKDYLYELKLNPNNINELLVKYQQKIKQRKFDGVVSRFFFHILNVDCTDFERNNNVIDPMFVRIVQNKY